MTDYITLPEFKGRVGITSSDKDVRIAEHITAASRRVDAICNGRTFGPHSGAVTARYFRPSSCERVTVDDCYEISLVGVDDADTGLYATAWATTDYETDPANGIGLDGQAGWPITQLRAISTRTFPTTLARRSVKVTAKWGWTAIPADVKEATYLLTNRYFYEVAVPGGITPPNLDIGLPGQSLRRPYTAEDLLAPYARQDRSVGVAG